MLFLSALTMIYAKEFRGKGSTVVQETYTQEISGILKSLRIVGKRRKKHVSLLVCTLVRIPNDSIKLTLLEIPSSVS